tara:strand:+ start:6087 stop:7361 length:1275 start_codon:yes stop_codon:yes gene_type:complete
MTNDKKLSFHNSNLIYILLISAFGPYLLPSVGFRFDHFIIYGIFFFLALSNRIYISRNSSILAILFLLFIIFISPFFNSINPSYVISNSLFISQIENYLQPIIIFLIFCSLAPRNTNDLDKVFEKGLEIILWLIAFNTLFSIYIFFNPDTSLIKIFTGSKIIGDFGGFSDVTNAELNLTTGKFSGVFSQTFIVGFIYSFGLLTWAYLYKNDSSERSKTRKTFLLLFITIGGVMSFSKIFIVIGIPLFLFFIGFKKSFYIGMLIFLGFLLILFFNNDLFEIISDYKAMNYIYRLIGFSGNFLDIFTSGRFSGDSLIIPGIINTLSTNTFFGFGYGSIETSDFSFYEIISLGGITSLLAYSILLVFLTLPIFLLKSLKDKYFYTFFIILSYLSSIAAPIFTANRISIIIWYVVIFFFYKSLKTKTI